MRVGYAVRPMKLPASQRASPPRASRRPGRMIWTKQAMAATPARLRTTLSAGSVAFTSEYVAPNDAPPAEKSRP